MHKLIETFCYTLSITLLLICGVVILWAVIELGGIFAYGLIVFCMVWALVYNSWDR